MSLHTKAVLYVAGVANSTELLMQANRFGFESATAHEALGIWRGIVERAFTLTIIGETATPAHIVYGQSDHYQGDAFEPILMPADPNGFETRIRNLAENLAREYGQTCVAFELAPVHFELTTAQASYIRNGG